MSASAGRRALGRGLPPSGRRSRQQRLRSDSDAGASPRSHAHRGRRRRRRRSPRTEPRPASRSPSIAEAARAALVTDESFLEHESPGHPERPARLRAVLEHLDATGLRSRMLALTPRDASDDEVLAVHDQTLLDALDEAARSGPASGWLDADTYVTPRSPAIARRAAGATLAALEAVLNGHAARAFAAVRPPGHHATGDTGMGFCLLNNVAIAAAAALRAGIERVAIVDWDVHHGNGTQAVFDAEPRVLYASTHAYPFYPGTGHFRESGAGTARGTKVNIPLPHGTDDAGMIAAYERVVVPALERFRPQLILVSSGWDAHALDPLTTLNVTTEGYTTVGRLVLDAASRLCAGRVVVTLEGGYDEHALAWCAGALCALMLGEEPQPDPQPAQPPPGPDVTAILDAVRAEVGLA
ncbi:MAG: histone deacetylase [Dehalococcoidia bacterium]|nr:histone deacetylase [Dehalococcoidia bacterium]